jgi:chromosome partitioning protein
MIYMPAWLTSQLPHSLLLEKDVDLTGNTSRFEQNTHAGAARIAFVHHKGGTGKTTSCINVAGWLAKMNKKVLVVDLDPQGNAVAALGVDRKSVEASLYDVLFSKTSIKEVILETDAGIWLVPSSIDLLAAERQMGDQANNAGLLKNVLKSIEKQFDYILIDVGPGSTLLMINGIVAAGNIIVPLDSGVFAYETLETLKTIVLDLEEELGIETNIMMILLRDYSTSIFDRIFDGEPTQEIKDLVSDFLIANQMPTVKIHSIPYSKKVHEAQMLGMPISHVAPFSDVGRAYKRIAQDVLDHSAAPVRQ